MPKPTYKEVKFASVMSLITTFFVTITLVSINVGFTERFLFVWLRSWLIAFVIALLSILFVGPVVRKLLNMDEKK
jgi:hypothetical protein